MTAQPIRAWRTTDGKIIEDPAKVQTAEFEIAFRRWWQQNARADWPDSMYHAIMQDRERLAAIFGELSRQVPQIVGVHPVPRIVP